MSTHAIPVLEASLEFFIGLAGQLIKGDTAKDLDELSKKLDALKEEKKQIIAQLIAKEGSILGVLSSQADAVARANDALEASKNWKLAGAIIGLIIVIIVAIVVTVFSCGSAGPAAVAGVAGVAAATVAVGAIAGSTLAVSIAAVLGVSATVAAALAIGVVIAAILVAIVSFVLAIPQILECVALVLEACGDARAAAALRQAADDTQKFFNESGVGTVLIVISIVASLYMAVIMLPLAGANIASIAASAGQAVASAVQITQNVLSVLTVVQLIGGLLQAGTAIASSVMLRDFAKLQRLVDMLRQRLAEIELEIKTLMHDMTQKKNAEEEVKDDIAARQEAEQRVMEALNKCAESYKQFLQAASILG